MAAPLTDARVLDALRPIVDPDFGKSIVDLGFVKNLVIEGGDVSFSIELTTPACPVKAEFEKAARERVAALPGVTSVAVTMTANTRGRATAAGAAETGAVLPGVRNTLAVASGKGGVGKSTIAVNLAIALRETGAKVGLMDADVYGPSLPLLTGVRGRPRAEQKRIFPLEGHGLSLMSMGFFVTENSPVIWRGPMVHGLIRQFLTDVEWGELDYLVVDMPPGTGDAALTLTQQAPRRRRDRATANDLSLIDSRKGLKMFEKCRSRVESSRHGVLHAADLPDRKYYLFGEGGGRRVAEELGVPFLGEVPIDPRVVEGGDRGRPILVHAPESDAALAIREIAGKVARRLAVLADSTPPLADANITWVSSPS